MPQPLQQALYQTSPRFTRPRTPLPSLLIHGSVGALWLVFFVRAFWGYGISAWAIGIIYIAYDTALIIFTFSQTYRLRHFLPEPIVQGVRPSLTVVIAAFNEAAILEKTIIALRQQSEPPEQIIIADDGSTDGTAELLKQHFNLETSDLDEISSVAPLRWLRAQHRGKAATLNLVIPYIETELMVTVDADTVLDRDAIKAMRDGFQHNPGLVAATGILMPICGQTVSGRVLEWFQTYEYIRNFLGRYAWGQMNSLLLISGAFAGFRRDAVVTVGGFDSDCLVEDYELVHRLRRYGYDHGLDWHSAVLGAARAYTSAPSTILAFLRQRRRWFGGFLETHFWYRDMVGARRYHRLGLMMLPVKTIDTFQPIYGLCAFLILLWYILSGKIGLVVPITGIIFGKIAIDLAFHVWSLRLYRYWVGRQNKVQLALVVLVSMIEPFSFQLLRHLGACWGWFAFLTGQQKWSKTLR